MDSAPSDPSGTPSSSEAGRQPTEASIGELLGNISNDLSTLMRQEVDLAKAELRREANKAGKSAGMLGGAGFAGYMMLLFVSVAAWRWLDDVMDSGSAAVIVAAVWAVIAAALFVAGRNQMRQVRPVPEQTVETVKQTPEALRPDPSR